MPISLSDLGFARKAYPEAELWLLNRALRHAHVKTTARRQVALCGAPLLEGRAAPVEAPDDARVPCGKCLRDVATALERSAAEAHQAVVHNDLCDRKRCEGNCPTVAMETMQ